MFGSKVDDRCGYDVLLVLKVSTSVDLGFDKVSMCAIIIGSKLVIVVARKSRRQSWLNENV